MATARTTEAVHLGKDATAWEIADAMDAHGVGSIVIVEYRGRNEPGEPIGIVTDRDLVRRVVAPGLDEGKVTAAEIMTPDPVVGDPDESAHDLLERMREHRVRRIPLVQRGRLEGVASYDDILLAVSSELWNVAESVRVELRETNRATGKRRRGEARDELVEDVRHYLSELESGTRSRIEKEMRDFVAWLGGRRDD